MGDAWFSALAFVCGLTCDLMPGASIDLPNREIHVGDVVDLQCLGASDQATIGSLVIAELPASATTLSLSRAALKSLARRRVPGLEFASDPGDADLIAFQVHASAPGAPAATCFHTTRTIASGAIVSSQVVATGPCDDTVLTRGQVYYDKTYGVPRAATDLPIGTNLGRLSIPRSAFDAGDRLTLAIAIGPVRIEREVEALQPATAGSDIFVRDYEGAVFTSPTASEARESSDD